MKTYVDDRTLFGCILPVMVLVIFVLLIIAYSWAGCHTKANMLDVEYRFEMFTFYNCRVSVGDLWIPIENYFVGGN